MSAFENNGTFTVLIFVVFLLAAFLVLGILVALVPTVRRVAYYPVSIICTGILLACGVCAVAAQTLLSGSVSWVLAGIAGVCIAVGVIELISMCLVLLTQQRPMRLLIFVSVAFFVASLVWYILMYLGSLALESAIVGVLSVAGALVVAGLVRHMSSDTVCEHAGPGQGNRKFLRREQAWFAFVIFGLIFNFFTMGLTFLPQHAGLPSSADVEMKPGSYALAAIVAGVALFAFSRGTLSRGETSEAQVLDRVLFACLPIATAIVLVSPFIDSALAESNIILLNLLPYAGIAMLNIIGWTAVVRLAQISRSSALSITGICLAGCAVAMAAGMTVFALLGSNGQKVSLTILACYLAAMIVFLVVGQGAPPVHKQTVTASEASSAEDACTKMAETYSLTPREQEVLVFLAQGRSARYIADQLVISPDTVRTHMKRIYRKCGVHTKEELLDLLHGQVEQA